MTDIDPTHRYWSILQESEPDGMKWIATFEDFNEAISGCEFGVQANMARNGSGGDGCVLDTHTGAIVALFRDAAPEPQPTGKYQERIAEYVRRQCEDYFG